MKIVGYNTEFVSISGITLKSCDHIIAKDKKTTAENPYDYSLMYAESDIEFSKTGNEKFKFPSGSIIIFKPGESNNILFENSDFPEFYTMHFETDGNSLFEKLGFKTSFPYFLQHSPATKNIFEKIILELKQKPIMYEKKTVNYFEILLIDFYRKINDCSKKMLYSKDIAPAFYAIQYNFHISYSLEEYAKMCSMSKYHFSRVFKNFTGFSPIEYRNNIRIERSKGMLADSSRAIETIAEQVGYSNAHYFSEAFKNAVKVSPTEYRKMYGYTKDE